MNGGLLLLVALVVAGYLAACAWWPFTAHGRCEGTGKLRSPTGKAWRPCPGCEGTGRRVRLGRRLYELGRGER